LIQWRIRWQRGFIGRGPAAHPDRRAVDVHIEPLALKRLQIADANVLFCFANATEIRDKLLRSCTASVENRQR
jgi:hypothetical protein